MVADFEGQIVVEPEPQIFDVAHEVGGDNDVDWRFGIGEGGEGFLEDPWPRCVAGFSLPPSSGHRWLGVGP